MTLVQILERVHSAEFIISLDHPSRTNGRKYTSYVFLQALVYLLWELSAQRESLMVHSNNLPNKVLSVIAISGSFSKSCCNLLWKTSSLSSLGTTKSNSNGLCIRWDLLASVRINVVYKEGTGWEELKVRSRYFEIVCNRLIKVCNLELSGLVL